MSNHLLLCLHVLKIGRLECSIDSIRLLLASGMHYREGAEGLEKMLWFTLCKSASNIEAEFLLQLCIDWGADVNAVFGVLSHTYPGFNHASCSPLHWTAAFLNQTHFAVLLINNGADVNAHDHEDNTSLHYAVDKRNIEMVEMLLEQANIRLDIRRTTDGKTPLDLSSSWSDWFSTIAGILRKAQRRQHRRQQKYRQGKEEEEECIIM